MRHSSYSLHIALTNEIRYFEYAARRRVYFHYHGYMIGFRCLDVLEKKVYHTRTESKNCLDYLYAILVCDTSIRYAVLVC